MRDIILTMTIVQRRWVDPIAQLCHFSFELFQDFGGEMKMGWIIGVLLLSAAFANAGQRTDWLDRQAARSLEFLMKNIEHPEVTPGVVIASPSKQDPNYFFHWVRDAALTMNVLVDLDSGTSPSAERDRYRVALYHFVDFSRANQLSRALTGLGEPKFYVDGTPFADPWGRPQNDGPALRAITLIRFAQTLLSEGNGDYVRAKLYDSKLPTRSVIKADLEYISHQWQKPSFDVWEEISGDHFYNRVVQRKALLMGADLAVALDDLPAAAWYRQQAKLIEQTIPHFWNASKNLWAPTLNRHAGLDYKTSDLDSVVVLAYLHGWTADQYLKFSDSQLAQTMSALDASFSALYPINRSNMSLGTAIGRYPEDLYAGNDFKGGNPWILLTMAFAEANYKRAVTLSKEQRWSEAQEAMQKADHYWARVQSVTPANGSMAEQIQRNTGELMSAADLTWNYASVLTAWWAREEARRRGL